MEEFEFKPITEGLGFHKKQVSLKDETKKAQDHLIKNSKAVFEPKDLEKVRQPAQAQSVRDLISSFPALDGLDFIEEENKQSKVTMSEPLPRRDLSATPDSQLNAEQVLRRADPELKVDPEVFQRKIDVVEVKPLVQPLVAAIAEAPEKKLSEKKRLITLEKRGPTLSAYLIDGFTIIGLTNVFMAALLLVTEVDVIYVLTHANVDLITQISVGAVLYSVALFYLLISRTFFSKSLGEWAMDYQLGNDEQVTKMSYPVRITIRALLNTMTGIVVLPLLSLLTRKDLLGSLSGLKLHKKVETWQ